jgi:hypothetical protein
MIDVLVIFNCLNLSSGHYTLCCSSGPLFLKSLDNARQHTGWGDELWTAFWGPATAVGGLWVERLVKLARRPSKRHSTYGEAIGSHQLRCYIAGCQLITKSFARVRPFMKICTGPRAIWILVPKMKKLLDDGLDLTWQPRGRKKRCERNEQWIYATDSGFCRQTCQRWHLPRAFETPCGPLGPEGRSLTENTPSADSATAYY